MRKTEETIVPLTPQITDEILSLRNRWGQLGRRVRDTRKRMNLSIEYFTLLEEAKRWFREGSKLLMIVARKATTVKLPEEATELLREINAYIKPGEEQQEKRIEQLKQLSTIIFGERRRIYERNVYNGKIKINNLFICNTIQVQIDFRNSTKW